MADFSDIDKVLEADDTQICATILTTDATVHVSGPYEDVKALIHNITARHFDDIDAYDYVRIPGNLLDDEASSWATKEDWHVRRDTITAVVDVASYKRGTRPNEEDWEPEL